MKFWDTSAVAPLLVEEQVSNQIRAAYKKDPELLVWWGTGVECASTIARLERSNLLSKSDTEKAFQRLRAIQGSWQEVQPVAEVREVAVRFLRVHGLRAADSLQLAAAFLAAEGRPSTMTIYCLDERLREAARLEGFLLEP